MNRVTLANFYHFVFWGAVISLRYIRNINILESAVSLESLVKHFYLASFYDQFNESFQFVEVRIRH